MLYKHSRRATRSFVAVNLAACPRRSSPPSCSATSKARSPGRCSAGSAGSSSPTAARCFSTEVGEMSSEMQVALLRVLQEGEFERVGASQSRRVDVRLIAATNRNLGEAVEEKAFPRTSSTPQRVPDSAAAAARAPRGHPRVGGVFPAARVGAHRPTVIGIESESMEQLLAFSWPGNIRQLQNVIEHSAIMSDGELLRVEPSLLVEKRAPIASASRLDAALHGSEQT